MGKISRKIDNCIFHILCPNVVLPLKFFSLIKDFVKYSPVDKMHFAVAEGHIFVKR